MSQREITSKIPKLRFREFQDEWEEKKIETLVNQGIIYKPLDGNHGNIHPKSSDFVKKGIPFIMSNSISGGKIDIDGSYKISNSQAETLQKGFTITGDVLLTHKGTVGLTAIVPKIDTAYLMLTPQVTYYRIKDKNILNNVFLKYIFDSQIFQKKLLTLAEGGTRPYVGITEQRSISFSVPIIEEQQKIASFLSIVDEKIEKLKIKKSLLEKYKKGVMQKIFSREIRFRDENGEEFGEWEEKKLGEICKIKTGKKDVNEGNPKGQYPFFTCAKNHTYSDLYSFDCEAILIAGNGEVGHCQRYSGKFEAYQRTYVLTDFKEDISYIFCHLNSTFQDIISSQKQMGAMPYIKLGMLTDFIIPMPSLPEQQKIASFLSEVDQKINAINTEIESTEKWKKGLLQGMFI